MKKVYVLTSEFIWNGCFEDFDVQVFQSEKYAKLVMAQAIADFRKNNAPMQYKEQITDKSYQYYIDGDYDENHCEMYLYEREILDAE